ncbi:MAG: twin-arginine translocase subunit TatB [Burkholderiales bacterium]|nr:twin-arginine translocase subunit TatB [Burkholderiales bacterium]
MFDISFSELLLIGVVALVVVGPERLPKVARTIGLLVGRAQRYVNDVKTELQREANMEEINRMREEARENAMRLEAELRTRAMEYEKRFQSVESNMRIELENVKKSSDPAPADPPEMQPEEDPRQMKIDFGEK